MTAKVDEFAADGLAPVADRFARLPLSRRWSLLIGLLAAPIVILLVVIATGEPWYPAGDFARTELLLRALPSHRPLIGVAARVGDISGGQGASPGPSMAYLLSPVYWLLGRSSKAMLVSVCAVHVAGFASALVLTRKRGGWAATLTFALVTAVLVRALLPDFFVEPWNVWVPVFGFFAFVVLIWRVGLGDLHLLPWAVAVGTHCTQSHVSYLLLTTGLLVATLIWLAVVYLRSANLDGAHLSRWLTISTGVFVLMWLPPLIEQRRAGTGNLRLLYDEFRNPGEPLVGMRAALKAMAGQLNLVGPWVVGSGHQPTDSPNWLGFIGFVALVIAGLAISWHRRDDKVLTFQVTLALVTALGLLSTSRISGVMFDYLIQWMLPLAALWAAVSIWSLTTLVVGGTRRHAASAAGLLTVGLLSVASAALAFGGEAPEPLDSRLVGALADQVDDQLDPNRSYLIRRFDPGAQGGGADGLVLELERRGQQVFRAGGPRWDTAVSWSARLVRSTRFCGS